MTPLKYKNIVIFIESLYAFLKLFDDGAGVADMGHCKPIPSAACSVLYACLHVTKAEAHFTNRFFTQFKLEAGFL